MNLVRRTLKGIGLSVQVIQVQDRRYKDDHNQNGLQEVDVLRPVVKGSELTVKRMVEGPDVI